MLALERESDANKRFLESAHNYIEENDKTLRIEYDVCDLFAPSGITRRARERGLRGGWNISADQVCPVTGKTWDMLNPTEVKRVWSLLYKTKPKLLVVSPPYAKDGTAYRESDREHLQSILYGGTAMAASSKI